MTDYSEYKKGVWYGWNGGECPVHPKSVVEYVWVQDGRTGISERMAGKDISGAEPSWSSNIKAFRVTAQHFEPREVWLRDTGHGVMVSCELRDYPGATLFREVLE